MAQHFALTQQSTVSLKPADSSLHSIELLGNYNPQDDILVRVIDHNRCISKDFICNRERVIKRMPYFDRFYKNRLSLDELDIVVHCDVKIFDILVNYLDADVEPRLDFNSAVPVMISANFLGIDSIVEKCLVFVSKHLEEVLRLPVDLSCVKVQLIERLAEKVALPDLATLYDPKDKISSKLYQRKLTNLIDCSSGQDS